MHIEVWHYSNGVSVTVAAASVVPSVVCRSFVGRSLVVRWSLVVGVLAHPPSSPRGRAVGRSMLVCVLWHLHVHVCALSLRVVRAFVVVYSSVLVCMQPPCQVAT